jgi:xanthine dehydrogenase/oxidase
MTACAAALATYTTNKPVKVMLSLNECMELVGKRYPWYAEYEVGFDASGMLMGIKIDYYSDAGCNPNDNSMGAIFDFCDNVYKCNNWHLRANLIKTNTAANTACRSPGFFPSVSRSDKTASNFKYFKPFFFLFQR